MPLHVNYQFRWKNFKAFEDTRWLTIRPLTVLIGPNNSGKTSIVTPLLLMSQTMLSKDARTPLVTRGPIVNVGNYRNLIHNHQIRRPLYFGIRFHTHDPKERPAGAPPIKAVGNYPPGSAEVTFKSSGTSPNIVLQRASFADLFCRRLFELTRNPGGTYRIDGMPFGRLKAQERTAIRNTQPVNFLFSSVAALTERRSISRTEETRRLKFSDAFSHYLQSLNVVEQGLASLLIELAYIGPLRDRPRRFYQNTSEAPFSVGPGGENMASILIREHSRIRPALNRWIRRFGFGNSLEIEELGNDLFTLAFKAANHSTNIADVGFGASQVLPLIVQAVTAPKGSLTVAEQPEIHLNPRLQCVLADLFAEMANSDHRLIVETHSEHFFLRLRYLVADKKIDHKKVAVYFVEKKGDKSVIREVPIEPNGHVSPDKWPSEFFEETLRESFALAAAQAKSTRTISRK